MSRKLLRLNEVAEILGLKLLTIRRWAVERRIPIIKIGKNVRVDPDELQEWINAQRIPIKK